MTRPTLTVITDDRLSDYEARLAANLRIAQIQSEVSTLLADEAHGLVCHLKISLAYAENLAECPATKVGMRDIARRQVETLRKEIGFLEQNIARA